MGVKMILHGEAEHLIKHIEDETIDLIVTSPPYNMRKAYERRLTFREYMSQAAGLIHALCCVLKPTGSICWQVGNYIEKGEVFPLDIYYYELFKEWGLKLRNRIIWHFGHGLHASKRLSGRYETLLWFTKSDDYVFNLDAIRVPAKYPNKKYYKGEKKGLLFDPPYSVEQYLRRYTPKQGGTAGRAEYWGKCKDEISRVLINGGIAISFCWDSVGMGKSRGFEIIEVHLICHGACHNDTIITIDKKLSLPTQNNLLEKE